ncbi:MAG: PHP domain-containing protein [Armatimonadota bacterium]
MIQGYSPPEKAVRECKYGWFDAWDRLVNAALRSAGSPRVEVGPGEIAMDPHVHSLFSHCSISQPEAIIRRAVKLGLSAICVMDHNDIRGSLDAIECARDMKHRGLIPESFLVIPGVEINSSCGHIGVLFVQETFPKNMSPEETVRVIHEAGGLAVAVHPYHSTGIRDAVFDAPFDAVEVECGAVFGARLVRQNTDLAEDPRLARVTKFGSSDAHYVNGIGTCYTVMKLSEPTLEAARRAIADGMCRAKTSAPCQRMRKLLGGFGKLD